MRAWLLPILANRTLAWVLLGSWIWISKGLAQWDPCTLQSWDPVLPAPEKTSRVLLSIDLDADGAPDCDYLVYSDGIGFSAYFLDYIAYADRCVALGKSSDSAVYASGDLVGLPSQKPFSPTRVQMQLFSWGDECEPFGCYRYSADEGHFGHVAVALIGMRLKRVDGFHYAWIRFARPCVKSWVHFQLDSFALHPLPNTPIPAGVVPQPELVVERGPGTVTLSWRPEWQGYRLEWVQQLEPDVAWKPVEGVVDHRVTLPASSVAGYFRLTKSP